MIKPLSDWATTEAATTTLTNTMTLTAGGHIVTILKAESAVSNKGIPMLNVYYDIKEGSEFDGFYMTQYNNRKKFNPDAAYKGIYRQQMTDEQGNTNKFFKGLITAIEDSNPGYKWDWNELTLKGKKLGMVFREEAYSYNGKTGYTVKPMYVCKASDAPAMPVPPRKELATVPAPISAPDLTPADDEPLPF